MNWVHASMFSYFPVRLSQINSLQYVSRSSTPCLDLCGIFSGDFLPVFARFFRVGLFLAWICWVSCGCRDVVGGLVTAWLILSLTDSHGKRKTNEKSLAGLSAERRLRRMFTIFILNNRVLRSWDSTQSGSWTITQPLLRVESHKKEESMEFLAQLCFKLYLHVIYN